MMQRVMHGISICYQLEGEPFHPNIKAHSNMHCLWLASETCQNVKSVKHEGKQAVDFVKCCACDRRELVLMPSSASK